jgi:hypothetical protein
MTKLNLGPYSSNWSANSVYVTEHKHKPEPALTQTAEVEETAKRGGPRGSIARAHKNDLTNG